MQSAKQQGMAVAPTELVDKPNSRHKCSNRYQHAHNAVKSKRPPGRILLYIFSHFEVQKRSL